MMIYEHNAEPLLRQVKTGWAAHGFGWAVYAKTRDDVLKKFGERQALYRVIDRRQYITLEQVGRDSTKHSGDNDDTASQPRH